MHFEFLAEEVSLGEVLGNILPKILPPEITFKIHDFRGKQNLLKNLPNRLKGYKPLIDKGYDCKIVVLIDEDREDCQLLKEKLETIAQQAGLITKTSRKTNQEFQVLNRIIVEELEAWFFGDVNAIRQAYPKVSPNLAKKQAYRNPDQIKGGTWEALERVLKQSGYHQGGLEKYKAALEISPHMNPCINKSESFQVFYEGLRTMVG